MPLAGWTSCFKPLTNRLLCLKMKGSIIAPLVFALVAGVGFEPTASELSTQWPAFLRIWTCWDGE